MTKPLKKLKEEESPRENWWKWGFGDKSSHLQDFPKLKSFLEKQWQQSLSEDLYLPDCEQLLESSKFKLADCNNIFNELDDSQFSNNNLDRLKFGFGKSYQDAIKILTQPDLIVPDFVLFPETTDEISFILKQSEKHKISIITFSGGTNVTECFAIEKKKKWICALNMQKMNKVLEIDPISLTARFECGIYGPELEKNLNNKGLTLGHFPQSFEFSTLGGWIATRSAGQESGKYGKIEDMVLGLKAVTPKFILENNDFPKHAAGIDTFPLLVGSEGTLGVIVEAKMKINPIPKAHTWVVALFKDFDSGADALRKMIQSGLHPCISRLSDKTETQMLSLLNKSEAKGLKKLMQNLTKSYLKKKGFDKPCMLMLQFVNNGPEDKSIVKHANKILRKSKAVILPSSVASNWETNRFSLPYIRESLIQHRILLDTFETSTYWRNLIPLYEHINDELKQKSDYFDKGGILFCHISHSYKTGASLYFSLIALQEKGNEMAQWNKIKEIVTSAIYEGGGAISHHHGIGKAHKKWYKKQLNKNERLLLKSIKSHLDPEGILNPGKLYDET